MLGQRHTIRPSLVQHLVFAGWPEHCRPRTYPMLVPTASKDEAIFQCCPDVGPSSTAQARRRSRHQSNIGPTSRVCRVQCWKDICNYILNASSHCQQRRGNVVLMLAQCWKDICNYILNASSHCQQRRGNVVLMLAHCLRRWPVDDDDISPTLGQRLVFAGSMLE